MPGPEIPRASTLSLQVAPAHSAAILHAFYLLVLLRAARSRDAIHTVKIKQEYIKKEAMRVDKAATLPFREYGEQPNRTVPRRSKNDGAAKPALWRAGHRVAESEKVK